ncbi:RIP metalloprotease [Phenylobacterium sp. LjRoot225]|uniref:M50 family metallopeptidase n=1 Tax=Phenylobacterium sp. LjRoot225 TaxID=3342285 RepID=UPI003ECDB904
MSVVQNILLYILPFILVIGVVVTVHELGHFLAARWLGTSIDRFSIGFGRAIASWRDKHGVEWRIGWLPLGGYVKFAGDENVSSLPDADDLATLRQEIVAREGAGALDRYFHFKPLWQRAIIVAGGPLANFLLAISIFAILLMTLGKPVSPARIDVIQTGSPAERAGFQVGDVVLKADGKTIEDFRDIRLVVALRSDTPTDFVVQRAGRQLTLTATPVRTAVVDQFGHVQRYGALGVRQDLRPDEVSMRRYPPIEAVGEGAKQAWSQVVTTVKYLGRLVTGRETADQLSGPLGIAQLSGDIAKKTAEVSPNVPTLLANWGITLLELVASISVGIGFLNLLPVPVLDGGHLLFYAFEAVARRPLTAKVQAAGYRLGLALVLGLMLFATWNDLQRLNVFKFFGALFS